MITTNLTLTNGATSEVPVQVTGITFEVDSKLAVNPSVVFPLDVAIDSSEIIGIDFDETLHTGDYTESITINTLGGRRDIVHAVTIDDLTPSDTEYILNGDFSNGSTDWTFGTGWSVVNEEAAYDGTGGSSNMFQDLFTLSSNTEVTLELDVIENNGVGTNPIDIGSVRFNGLHLEVGHHIFTETILEDAPKIIIYGRQDEVFIIDNISLVSEEVAPIEGTDVTTKGFIADGVFDNSDAWDALALDTAITDWYFPSGTYRMHDKQIPSHLNVLYGETDGSSIVIDIRHDDDRRAINFDINNVDGFILDSITFDSGADPTRTNQGSLLRFHSLSFQDNITIRNCNFIGNVIAGDGADGWKGEDAIKFYKTTNTEYAHNIVIEHCTFTDINRGSLEIVDRTNDPNSTALQNIIARNNTFVNTGIEDGFWRMAVSHSRARNATLIENNTFDGFWCGIEFDDAVGNEIANNNFTNMYNRLFIETVTGLEYEVQPNYVHHNYADAEVAAVLLYTSNTLYESNYLVSTVFIEAKPYDEYTISADVLRFTDNILIKSQDITSLVPGTTRNILIRTDPVLTAEFSGNSIYAVDATYENISSGGTTISFNADDAYNDGAFNCTTGASDFTGVSCTQSYTGELPAVPSDVGVQT